MIIEIRPIIEKMRLKRKAWQLKRGLHLRKTHKVPHLTLVYNFTPKSMSPSTLCEIIRAVAVKYGRLRYSYNGYEVRKGEGGYVFSYKIEPSPELKRFRRELYRAIKLYVNEDPVGAKFNANGEDEYWFHAAISFHMDPLEARRVGDFIDGRVEDVSPVNHSIIESEVIRIPIIMKGKIAYEYDMLLDKVLSRREALSDYYKRLSFAKYREMERMEIKKPAHRRMPTAWIMSDTHFYHEPIIDFTGRPFSDIKEMNEILVSNWNNTVSPSDTVYFLGDLALGRERDPPKRAKPWLTESVAAKLNGKKIFINGNHDPLGFGEYWKEIEYKGIRFLLIHNPKGAEEDWPGDRKRELKKCIQQLSNSNTWTICGHTHNGNLVDTPFINFGKKRVNVSAELIRYTPIELDKVVSLIRSPMKANIISYK